MAVPPVVAVELLAGGEGPGQGGTQDEEGGDGEELHGDVVSTAGGQQGECWGHRQSCRIYTFNDVYVHTV